MSTCSLIVTKCLTCRNNRRLKPLIIVIILIFSLLLIFRNHQYNPINQADVIIKELRHLEAWPQVTDSVTTVMSTREKYEIIKTTAPSNWSIGGIEMNPIISKQRELVGKEMNGYHFDKLPTNIKDISDLVPEQGGKPIRSVLVTSWRSGSTFLGAILNSHPGTWYHYEPLNQFQQVQIRGPPIAEAAVRILKNLLKCNFKDIDFGYEKKEPYFFMKNSRFWTRCKSHPDLCFESEFVTRMCQLFPVQSMKIVRLRLHLAEELLKDKSLGVKMVYLVRDPRGTLQSRRHREWCQSNPDCWQPSLLCDDLVDDYLSAVRMAEHYPDSFMVIRYEDLSLATKNTTQKLMSFLGLNFHRDVQRFIQENTRFGGGRLANVADTKRNSKTTPFEWRTKFSFAKVQEVQDECGVAMKMWGYAPALDEEHQKTLNPLLPYILQNKKPQFFT